MKEGGVLNVKISLPDFIIEILDKLKNAGYEAYVVGGAVRDSILGKEPHDYDIATNARPQQIMEVFSEYEVVPTGLQHGTVTVVIDHIPVEITTYRCDGKYSDGRHPDDVKFVDTIEEDLSRRDFTINAMAYSPDDGLIDPFGGMEDIHNKQIRCVGLSEDRLKEDALRILRAIRFSCQLEYRCVSKLSFAIDDLSHLLNNISIERITSEFCKIVMTKKFYFPLIFHTRLFYTFIPELKDMYNFDQKNPWHDYNLYEHTIFAVECCESDDLIVKLTVLFHDIGKPHCYQEGTDGIRHFKGHSKVSAEMTDKIMKRMKFSNDIREKVVQLVSYHDAEIIPQVKYIKRWLNKIGEEQFKRLVYVQKADKRSQKRVYPVERIKQFSEILNITDKIVESNLCFSLKDLAINGKDLLDNDFKEGKIIGDILNKLLEEVIDGKIKNNKIDLLNRSSTMMNRAKGE